jgi:hypothetical protein
MPAYTNAKTHVPALFKEIMRNHRRREELNAGPPGSITREGWIEQGGLLREMREFRRGAEKALCWNADKGNTS